jgi:hypothetical protein
MMPYRAFGSSADPNAGTFFRRDTISVVYIDSTPAQTMLAAALPAGSLAAQVAPMPNCPPDTATQTCGFEPGTRVVVLGGDGRWDTFNVASGGAGLVVLEHRGAPSSGHIATDPIAAVKLATYYLRKDSTGTSQLFRYDGWASESPVVDDVVSLTFDYFGDVDPPRRTPTSLDDPIGPWTTYGPKPPPIGTARGSWPAGENCAFMVVEGAHVARLADLTGTASNLVALTAAELTDGPWCPDDVAPNRFDADLLRVRSVRVTLRIRSTLASVRGPSGTLLAPRGALSTLSDVQVQFDVAPRNLQR